MTMNIMLLFFELVCPLPPRTTLTLWKACAMTGWRACSTSPSTPSSLDWPSPPSSALCPAPGGAFPGERPASEGMSYALSPLCCDHIGSLLLSTITPQQEVRETWGGFSESNSPFRTSVFSTFGRLVFWPNPTEPGRPENDPTRVLFSRTCFPMSLQMTGIPQDRLWSTERLCFRSTRIVGDFFTFGVSSFSWLVCVRWHAYCEPASAAFCLFFLFFCCCETANWFKGPGIFF